VRVMVYFPLRAIYLGVKLWILIYALVVLVNLKQFFMSSGNV